MENTSSVGSIPVIQNKRVFVGNLHSSTTEGDLIKVFSKFGTVTDVNYIWHKFGPAAGERIHRRYCITFTSVLRRAVRLSWMMLNEIDHIYGPAIKSCWRLNDQM
jgi:RNA recognition motif-containing protein